MEEGSGREPSFRRGLRTRQHRDDRLRLASDPGGGGDRIEESVGEYVDEDRDRTEGRDGAGGGKEGEGGHDDFVARIKQSHARGLERTSGSGTDRDVGFRISRDAIVARQL